MADLYVKEWPVGQNWAQGAGGKRYLLCIDEYEFVNLRWLFENLWHGRGNAKQFNNGDWLGQIRHALVDGSSRIRIESRPNTQELLAEA